MQYNNCPRIKRSRIPIEEILQELSPRHVKIFPLLLDVQIDLQRLLTINDRERNRRLLLHEQMRRARCGV